MASGMAAVAAAVLCQVKAGDHIVAARALFGSCLYVVEEWLPRFGVASTLVDGPDLDQWRAAMRPNTKVCFLESPTNPQLEVLDIAAIAEIAHAGGAKLGTEFQVNSYTSGVQGQAAASSDAQGKFVVVWTSTGSGGTDTSEFSVQAQRFAADA